MTATPEIEAKLKELCTKGILVKKKGNQVIKVAYQGNDKEVSSKWNIIIYKTGSLVCVDHHTLTNLLNNTMKSPDLSKSLIQIDDSGWGFPIGGVMVGCYITGKDFKPYYDSRIVNVSFFQGQMFENKYYLSKYTDEGLNLLDNAGTKPETHRVEICTGYINSELKEELRTRGYSVEVKEIKGELQNLLEDDFKSYIKRLIKTDIYYDPKECGGGIEISRRYSEVVAFAEKNCPHFLKTGWKSLKAK